MGGPVMPGACAPSRNVTPPPAHARTRIVPRPQHQLTMDLRPQWASCRTCGPCGPCRPCSPCGPAWRGN
eukprot:gene20747-biopygen2601